MRKILMLLAATGLLGACTSDEEARVGEPMPIRLSAKVDDGSALWGGNGRQTRAATTSTTQDTELLDGQTVDAYIQVKDGDWLAQPVNCTVTGNTGDLTYTGDVFYPMDGTPVSIYAVHPAYTSAAVFTVGSDQTDDAGYAASDLCYSKTADYNRSESAQALVFSHVLSKIIVNVQTALGTVNSVKLRAKKSTTMTYPVANDYGYTLGTADGLGIIEMNEGGAAIIPPQTTAAAGDVRIIVEIGGKGTFVYNFPASTVFASNTEYTYTVNIGATITVTSSIAAWGSDAAGDPENEDVTNNNVVHIGRPKLPIEYVAAFNLASPTAFAADNNASSSMLFSWNATETNANAGPKEDIQAMINGTAVTGFHLPSVYEWMSILAPYYATGSAGAMIDVDGSDGQRIYYRNGQHLNMGETVAWGVTNNNGTYSYEVNRKFYNDYNCPDDAAHTYIGYGLRFKDKINDNYVNGIYTCGYRYEYKAADTSVGGGSSLTVMVKYVGSNQNVTLSTISDESWWSSPDFTLVLPACGFLPSTNAGNQNPGYYSSLTDYQKSFGYYWSATQRDGSYVFNVTFCSEYVNCDNWHNPGRSFSVRLFKDKSLVP